MSRFGLLPCTQVEAPMEASKPSAVRLPPPREGADVNEERLQRLKMRLDRLKFVPELAMSWQRNQCMGPGLRNIGNTCYLNSVLQCLTYTPPLANFCCSRLHTHLCVLINGGDNSNCAFCLLENRISKSLNTTLPVDAPIKIANKLRIFAKHLTPHRQEDAHEFLRYTIDACIESCSKLCNIASRHLSPDSPIFENTIPRDSLDQSNPSKASDLAVDNRNHSLSSGINHENDSSRKSSGPGSSKKDETPANSSSTPPSSVRKEYNSVMHEIFGGVLRNQVKCLSCGAESIRTEPIMDLSLDVSRKSSLKESLNQFFLPEVLDGDNKYRCQRCQQLSAAEKSMALLKPPNILVAHFKRFESVFGGKVDRHIAFDETLLLRDYMSLESKDQNPKYSLYAIIVHAGLSLNSGHYYAFIKDALGSWWCCNDCSVSRVSLQSVLSEKAYLLFYSRTNSPSVFSSSLSTSHAPSSITSTSLANQDQVKLVAGISCSEQHLRVHSSSSELAFNGQAKEVNNSDFGMNCPSDSSNKPDMTSDSDSRSPPLQSTTTSRVPSEVQSKVQSQIQFNPSVEHSPQPTTASTKSFHPVDRKSTPLINSEHHSSVSTRIEDLSNGSCHENVKQENKNKFKRAREDNIIDEREFDGLDSLIDFYTGDENNVSGSRLQSGKTNFQEAKTRLIKAVREELKASGWYEKAEREMLKAKRTRYSYSSKPGPDIKSIILKQVKKEMRTGLPGTLLQKIYQFLRAVF